MRFTPLILAAVAMLSTAEAIAIIPTPPPDPSVRRGVYEKAERAAHVGEEPVMPEAGSKRRAAMCLVCNDEGQCFGCK